LFTVCKFDIETSPFATITIEPDKQNINMHSLCISYGDKTLETYIDDFEKDLAIFINREINEHICKSFRELPESIEKVFFVEAYHPSIKDDVSEIDEIYYHLNDDTVDSKERLVLKNITNVITELYNTCYPFVLADDLAKIDQLSKCVIQINISDDNLMDKYRHIINFLSMVHQYFQLSM
jgi:hypothetical protein